MAIKPEDLLPWLLSIVVEYCLGVLLSRISFSRTSFNKGERDYSSTYEKYNRKLTKALKKQDKNYH